MISENTTQAAEQYQDLFKRFAGALQDHLETNGAVDEARVQELVDDAISKATLPRPVQFSFPDGKTTTVDGAHAQLEDVMEIVGEGQVNVLLVGPAGSGKTTLAKSVAKALDVPFGMLSLSSGVTETHLFGRWMPQESGKFEYIVSRFVEMYSQPGVFLLDELDAADANVMVAVNAALANGHFTNVVNGLTYTRHPQCIIIAAANTYGRGGDTMYVGRNALDAATLDRFVLGDVFVDYDREVEKRKAAALPAADANALLAWIENLRGRIAEYKVKRIASTRLVERAVAAMLKGKSLDQVKARFFKSWSKDELTKVGGAL